MQGNFIINCIGAFRMRQLNLCCHCLITEQPLQQLPADAGSFSAPLLPTSLLSIILYREAMCL